MSEVAAKEIEAAAKSYASEAIRLDSQGARGMAIQMYQKSISTLVRLAKLYPDYSLNRIYIERASTYQERIKALRSSGGGEELPGSTDNPISNADRSGTSTMVAPLKASYDELVLEEKPTVNWSDVVGLDDAKNALRESITFPTIRPDLFPLGWPRGVLLYGPPGCGKTLLAAAVAAENDGYFINVDAATIMSKWLGEAERNVAKLFSSARNLLRKGKSAVIIFIDELDSLLGSRNQEVGGEVRVRNQFLKEMDGIGDKGKKLHLYVIGATNKPWSLDWPFLRRFQKRIFVPLPNIDARTEMLEMSTSPLHMDSQVKMSQLADILDGYSGSDITDICQSVQLKVVSELFETGRASEAESRPREITIEDIKDVLKRRRPSVSTDMIRAYDNWSENYKAL